jgi:hypothetical protein
VFINRKIVIVLIFNEILLQKVISARKKIMEAGDCLESFYQETRADPGIVGGIQ